MADDASILKALQAEVAMLRSKVGEVSDNMGVSSSGEGDDWPPMAVSGGMDYSDYAFGFTLNPDGDNAAEVGINAGKVRHGTRTAVSVSSAKIVCSDQTWIFVAYTYGSTGTITSSASEPVDTETVHNHALYLVTLTSGVASVESGDIKHLGDIFIPGAFA